MNTFEAGQKVTWTNSTQRGSTVRLSTREGTVVEIMEHACRVRKRNGRHEIIGKKRLTPANQKSEITQFFLKLAEAVAKDTQTEN